MKLSTIKDIDVTLNYANGSESTEYLIDSESRVLHKTEDGKTTIRFDIKDGDDHEKHQIILLQDEDGDFAYKTTVMEEAEFYDMILLEEDGDLILKEDCEPEVDHLVVTLYRD